MRRLLPLLLAACTVDPSLSDPDDDPSLDDDTDAADVLHTGLPGLDPATPLPFADTAVTADALWLGSWRDLDHWGFWTDLVARTSPRHDAHARWGFDTRARFRVKVTDAQGPAVGAEVTLLDGTDEVFAARTDARGEASVFASLLGEAEATWTLAITDGREAVQQVGAVPLGDQLIPFALGTDDRPVPTGLDLVLYVDRRDATLLEHARDRLPDAVARLLEDDAVRIAVRTFDGDSVTGGTLDDDATDDLAHLEGSTVAAASGAPLDEVLEDALALPWRDDARARVALVLTTKPDPGTSDLAALQRHVLGLSAAGVALHPIQTTPDVASSFLLRDLALVTGGAWHFALVEGPPARTDLVGEHGIAELGALVSSLADDARHVP